MSRVGKIARLSQFVREQLNRRIEDGETGRQLVQWLNGLSPVKEMIEVHFNQRPITEQNLSEWKQGGFKDWQGHQETRALARNFLAEAEEIEEEVGETPLSDRLSATVALALARLLHEALNGEKGPAQRMAILEAAREFARLRRQDHQMQRLRREQEIWEQEDAEKHEAEMKAMKDGIKDAKIRAQVYGNFIRQEYCEGMAAGTLDPERAGRIQQFFATHAEFRRKCGVKDLPSNGAEPSGPQGKSDLIRPNPTKSD